MVQVLNNCHFIMFSFKNDSWTILKVTSLKMVVSGFREMVQWAGIHVLHAGAQILITISAWIPSTAKITLSYSIESGITCQVKPKWWKMKWGVVFESLSLIVRVYHTLRWQWYFMLWRIPENMSLFEGKRDI